MRLLRPNVFTEFQPWHVGHLVTLDVYRLIPARPHIEVPEEARRAHVSQVTGVLSGYSVPGGDDDFENLGFITAVFKNAPEAALVVKASDHEITVTTYSTSNGDTA